MKIVNLIEDTEGVSRCIFEHGLSFYIETDKHKILFDTGASGAFLENAKRLEIDLKKVDTVVISHGHYDHTGGLLDFTEINSAAKIYINKKATGRYYNCRHTPPKYIGMDKKIGELGNVIFIDGNLVIDDELSIFTGIIGKRPAPMGNLVLKEKTGEEFVFDSFRHEQHLVIREGEKRVLFSGCAHKGILNILDKYREIYGGEPNLVISGFHTMMPEYSIEDKVLIAETARELSGMNAVFYSGHCTGEYPLKIMKKIMGNKLNILHSGDKII